MSEKYQKRVLEDLMKRPIPRKWIGIVKLQMVREGKVLYGTRRFTSAVDAVSMVRPIFAQSDREMMVVMSVNTRLEPLALEIVAVGGVDSCNVDIKNIFKHACIIHHLFSQSSDRRSYAKQGRSAVHKAADICRTNFKSSCHRPYHYG